MRVLQYLAAALLPLGSLAAKKPTGDVFQTYHAKQSASGALNLDAATYTELTKSSRDYSVAVLLTAMDARFGCALCTEIQPEWELLAKQWTKGDQDAESRLLFGTLDFASGKEIFQAMQLQTVPVLLIFKPTTGPHAEHTDNPARYEFNTAVASADPLHAWISRQLPNRPHPPFVRPVNYVKIAVGITAVLGVITLGSVVAPTILPIIQNRNLWAAISLILVVLFTSGHMYNHIRSVPYIAGDGKGKIAYFANGFQSQFGMETQIVAAIYAVLAFASISLALKVPRISDPRAQQVAVLVWAGVILCVYSFLISVFKFKNGGYPFWLPPF